jgi:hypothetical protein
MQYSNKLVYSPNMSHLPLSSFIPGPKSTCDYKKIVIRVVANIAVILLQGVLSSSLKYLLAISITIFVLYFPFASISLSDAKYVPSDYLQPWSISAKGKKLDFFTRTKELNLPLTTTRNPTNDHTQSVSCLPGSVSEIRNRDI